jgi:hypothetical protein
MKLKITMALMLALAPTLASARSKGATVHMRPQMFHDRSPKPHLQETRSRHA